jgi:hypothetical protein
MNIDDTTGRIKEILEKTSLGTAGARELRERTPDDVAASIADRVRAFLAEEKPTIDESVARLADEAG